MPNDAAFWSSSCDHLLVLSRLASRLVRLPLRLVPSSAVVRVLTGALKGRRWIVGSATHGCWIGTYEPPAQRTFAEWIRPGDVVFDVGANAGFFTLLASKLVGSEGRVYAFEPLPRNLGYLREHIRINDAGNVTVLPVAVSDRTGMARFESSGNPAMGGLSEHGGLEVQTESLDGLWAADAIASPSFIKMDIEGGESSALAGAVELLREARPVILLSTHGYVQHERCMDRLSELGYEIELLRDGARDGDYLVRAVPRGGRRRPTSYPTL